MTTGVTLYLVSACGTAEEFVAAFRRYADRTGLFIPTAAPLPAGRRGHLTLTLKDGGVMIAGEAEILQSSAKPTVLQGRPGMTVKFVDADDLSKTVIAELEKARLAMKPAPPSVPPRPTAVPAEPRPVVPAVGGRIDAANALAECVVIGDAAQLVDTSGAPKAVSDGGSGKAKFAVPAILPVGAPRPNTPSTPPPLRPHSPSAPPPMGGIPSPLGSSPSAGIPRPKTPSVPPDPTSKPLPRPASKSIPPRMTSIGFPTIDKQPAPSGATPKPAAAAVSTGLASLLETKHGTHAPANRTQVQPAQPPSPELVSADDATAVGDFPPSPPATKTDPMPTAPIADGVSGTTPGTSPPTPTGSQKLANKSGATPILDAAAGADGMSGTTPGTVPPAAPTTSMPPAKPMAAVSPAADKIDRRTSIGFPAMRTPFETQPVGIVRPPAGTATPAPPVVPSGAVARSGATPAPRGKNPTRPPLSPRHPTPVAPVPIVRSPAKAAPAVEDAIVESAIVEEEKTDLSEVPAPPGSRSGPLATPASVDPHANTQIAPQRSGGMRASEIMAAIPTDDWTMSPDASAPTVLPTGAPVATPPTAPVIESEPTPAPAMAPKGPPTGNWSISLDPETGWSEPAKVPAAPTPPAAEPPKKPRRKRGDGTSGNPDMAVADDEGFTAQKWDDKPTGIGEAKIEIDSTLMEPLKPMPALDDEDDEPVGAAPAARSEQAIKYITPPAGLPAAGNGVPPPLSPGFPTPAAGAATVPNAFAAPAPSPFATGPVSTASPFAMPPSTPPQLFANAPRPMTDANLGFAQGAAATVPPDAAKRKRTLFIGIGAVIALAAGFVLVLMLAGGKNKKPTPTADTGSSSAQPAVVVDTQPATGSATEATGSGSADVAVAIGSGAAQPPDEPDGSAGSAAVAVTPTEAPPSSGACNVSVTSTPRGADVLIGDAKLGTTPAQLELPCGVEAKLTLRKAKYITTSRAFTPIDGKGNQVAFRLARPTFTLKVTSTPAGATIMVAGKSMGVTPATIRLPAYEGAAVMVGKAGYQTASKVVTPKSNNLSHHVVLKKKGKR